MAVLGPIDTEINPQMLHNREDFELGSEVYLVGYPAETEEFPQPAITRGIVSGIREWEAIGMTYFETDISVTGWRSGGALVSGLGDIIGISGLRFSDNDLSLVASAADVGPLANALIQGKDASVLGSRRFTSNAGQRQQNFFLESPWDIRTFLIEEPIGTIVELHFTGKAHGLFSVLDPFGRILAVGENGTPETKFRSFKIDTMGRYSVLAEGHAGQLTIFGDVDLIAEDDPDDGIAIFLGDSVAGNIDVVGDLDYFLLNLEEGETVEIRVESMNIDAELTVDFPGSRADQVLMDHDSGSGLSGADATMFYRPIQTGVHYVVVNDATFVNTGGYLISVNRAPADVEAIDMPAIYATVDTPFGPMIAFESSLAGFSVHAPADWTPGDLSQPGTELVLIDGDNNMVIVVEDVLAIGAGEATLEQYSNFIVSLLGSRIPGFELLSRENVQITQGLEAVRLEYLAVDGLIHGSRLIHLDANNVAINITVHTKSQVFGELNEMVDYIFESLRSE